MNQTLRASASDTPEAIKPAIRQATRLDAVVAQRIAGARGRFRSAGGVLDLRRFEHAMGRVAVGWHHQHGGSSHEHRFAGIRVENLREQLFGGVDVGPILQLVACQGVHPWRRSLIGVVACAVGLVVVGLADHEVQQTLLLVEA